MGDRFGVLPFSVLYDEFQLVIIGVDRKPGRAAVFPQVTTQEVKSVVPFCL